MPTKMEKAVKQSCQPVRIFRISYGNQTKIRRYGSVFKNTHFGKSRKRYIITRNIDKLVSCAGCWNARFYSTETCHARCASSVQSGLHEILTVIIPTWIARAHACRRCSVYSHAQYDNGHRFVRSRCSITPFAAKAP